VIKQREKLINEILKQALKESDSVRLPCAKALAIAKQFGIAPLDVGNICNEQNIKLCQCQLGCFK
jgi:hypothetical protein